MVNTVQFLSSDFLNINELVFYTIWALMIICLFNVWENVLGTSISGMVSYHQISVY